MIIPSGRSLRPTKNTGEIWHSAFEVKLSLSQSISQYKLQFSVLVKIQFCYIPSYDAPYTEAHVGALLTMTFFFAYTQVRTNGQNLGFTCAISFCLVSSSLPPPPPPLPIRYVAEKPHAVRHHLWSFQSSASNRVTAMSGWRAFAAPPMVPMDPRRFPKATDGLLLRDLAMSGW